MHAAGKGRKGTGGPNLEGAEVAPRGAVHDFRRGERLQLRGGGRGGGGAEAGGEGRRALAEEAVRWPAESRAAPAGGGKKRLREVGGGRPVEEAESRGGFANQRAGSRANGREARIRRPASHDE